MELMRRIYLLIDSIFFDTDCICAFLWVNNECLLEKMYPGKIVIPKEVYDEIDKPAISHLKAKVDRLIAKGSVKIVDIDTGSEEYEVYKELTTFTGKNKVIGSGEAASISLAKKYHGILGSNNLRDVEYYIKKYSLRHTTTGDLLVQALEMKLITEKQGNIIWAEMLKKRRRIGANSFSEYLEKKRK